MKKSRHTNKLEKETTFLIAIIKGDTDKINQINDPDWEGIIELAKKNSIAQVLYTSLQLHNIKAPKSAIDVMHRIHLESAAINIKLYNELEIILKEFEEAGISAVPIKGAWLAEAVYTNIALREMGDIDLWINRNQLEKARQIMYELGYSMHSTKERPQALQDELLGETKMLKPGHTMVELHWNIFPGEWFRHTTHIDEEEIWNRTLPLKGEKIRQLLPEDAIIQICAHLAVSHQMSIVGLRTLVDLYFLIQRFNIDWSYVNDNSKDFHLISAAWLVFRLFNNIFRYRIKGNNIVEIAPGILKQWILKCSISPGRFIKGLEIKGFRRFLFLLTIVDRPIYVFRLLWRALIPERTWLILRYGLNPEFLWQVRLQYFLHPIKIILKRKI